MFEVKKKRERRRKTTSQRRLQKRAELIRTKEEKNTRREREKFAMDRLQPDAKRKEFSVLGRTRSFQRGQNGQEKGGRQRAANAVRQGEDSEQEGRQWENRGLE